MEGEAGAEGVAEEVERGVGHLAEQPAALLQVGGDPGGPGVAGEVHPTRVRTSASGRPNGPHNLPVWVKPWARTSGGPLALDL